MKIALHLYCQIGRQTSVIVIIIKYLTEKIVWHFFFHEKKVPINFQIKSSFSNVIFLKDSVGNKRFLI